MRASVGVERVQAPGRADEQPRRLAGAALVERDLAPQLLDLRRLQRVDRAGLDRDQQLQRRVERAGVVLRSRRGEQAARAGRGFGRERGRGLEERGGGRDAAARQRAAGRAFQLLGDALVGRGRRLRAMPGAPVRVELRIGGVGQRGVQRVAFLRRRRAVRRRAHRRVAEPHLRADLEQPGVGGRRRGVPDRCRAARPRATPATARRRGRRPRAAGAGRVGAAAAPAAAGRCPRGRPRRAWTAEAAGQLRGAHVARQLQQSQRVAPGLGDDPLADVLVEPAGDTVASRALASSWSSPSRRSSGRPASWRRSLGSRTANTIATRSASSRRATNPSTWAETSSSHWKSSTRHNSGSVSATSANSVSAASPTRKRSRGAPDAGRTQPAARPAVAAGAHRCVRAADRRAGAGPRTAAPSRTRRRRSGRL